MPDGQVLLPPLRLLTERLGPLPLVNHVLERLGLEALLDRFVPTKDPRCALPYARALGVLLRSIVVEREPIYRQQETVISFAPGAFGLDAEQAVRLHDDALGRALDRLFDADRGTLLAQVVLAARERFAVKLEELHNDSTTGRGGAPGSRLLAWRGEAPARGGPGRGGPGSRGRRAPRPAPRS
jgi:uncharacterized protein DUF4277